MIESSHGHVRADILAHGNQRNTQNSKGLELVVFLFSIQMIIAEMQHFLDLQHVSGTSVSADINHGLSGLGDRVFDRLEGFKNSIRSILSSKEEKSETESHEFCIRFLQVFFFSFHEGLKNGTADLAVASTNKDQTTRQGSKTRQFHAETGITNNRQQELKNIFSCASSISDTETGQELDLNPLKNSNKLPKDGTGSQLHLVAVDILGQDRQSGIGFMLDIGRSETDRHERTRLDIIFIRVSILVNMRQSVLNVPEVDASKRRGGAHHSVIFVLVDPVGALFSSS